MKRPLVFGIGLSRTGTASLAAALTILGWDAVHFPEDDKTATELQNGVYDLSLLSRYNAVCDTPAAAFFPQFVRRYPEARFILTRRPFEQWIVSMEAYWSVHSDRRLSSQYHCFVDAALYGSLQFSSDRFKYAYERHQREVEAVFACADSPLLTLDICDGAEWQSLCSFLDVPVPDVAFPHKNAGMLG